MNDEEWEIIPPMILEDMDRGNFNIDNINFPIIESIHKLLESKNDTPEAYVMFYTQQNDHSFSKTDTLPAFKVIKKCIENGLFFDGHCPKVIGYPITNMPYSYDAMLDFYQEKIKRLLNDLEIDKKQSLPQFYISVTGGTPACNFALIHAVHGHKELRDLKHFIYSPRPTTGQPQPQAEEINVDTFLSEREVLITVEELINHYHYGQAKMLVYNLGLLGDNQRHILIFLDCLLLRRNQLYQRTIEKLNLIPKDSEITHQRFIAEMMFETQSLANGSKFIKSNNNRNINHRDVKKLLVEQYWKLVSLYQMEQYNEWVTQLITFNENLLKLKTMGLLLDEFHVEEYSDENFRAVLNKVQNEELSFINDPFYKGKNKYPHKKTYQLFIKHLNPDSYLASGSEWVQNIEKLNGTRNEIVHSLGGLQKEDIEKCFPKAKWDITLKTILTAEFHIHLSENPLANIHKEFISWLYRNHNLILIRKY
jgi:hypothetical protein